MQIPNLLYLVNSECYSRQLVLKELSYAMEQVVNSQQATFFSIFRAPFRFFVVYLRL